MESSSQESSAVYEESKTSGGRQSFELGRASEGEFSSYNSSSDFNRKKSSTGSKETKLVKLSKYVVLTFLVVACTACAALVYVVSSNAQEDSFVRQVGKQIIAQEHVLVF
jgi:hypothetical protein